MMREDERDATLVDGLLTLLGDHHVDYTLFFRRLCALAEASAESASTVAFDDDDGRFREWTEAWRARLATESEPPEARATAMRRANPAFIPRNHRVEEVIEAAVRRGDFEPFETLLRVLGKPYEDQPEHARLADAPTSEQRVHETFCGT
jgi:uncharacterized protein YdiU (UPF0061 family)